MEYIKNKKSYNLTLPLSFLIPCIIVILGYVAMGIYPFGDSSILVMDLHGQYFPMIKNLKSALANGDLLYSFNAGLGFNMLSQGAYYTNSIFWYILALFPEKLMIPVFQFTVAMKFGLSGLTFSYFLTKKYKNPSALTVAFSVAYSLCGYALAFLSQTMWTDAVILFPLVICGLEKLLDEDKPLVYFISLSALLISSFYIGFSVCIFVTLYFAVHELSLDVKIKERFRRFVRFAVYSAASGGCAAVFLLPTYLAITKTKANGLGFDGTIGIYHGISDFIRNFLPFSGNSLEFGVANIYCGIFILAFVFLYVFNGKISLEKRILNFCFLTFLFLSLEFNVLDYVWHGFHFPNQLPGRWSFCIVFLALSLSYNAILHLKEMRLPFIIASAVIPTALLILFERKEKLMPLGIILLLVYFALVLILKNLNARVASTVLSVFMILEISANAMYVFDSETRTYGYNYYVSDDDAMAAVTEKYESGSDDFYRTETSPYLSFNSGQLYGHKGISYYSSMMSGAEYDFCEKIGFGIYAKNVSTIFGVTPVTNSMLGVKYIYDRYNSSALSTLNELETLGGVTVRENKYYLPFAFMVNENIKSLSNEPFDEPLEYQNALLREACGAKDVFFKVDGTKSVDNATIVESDGKEYYYRSNRDEKVKCMFTYMIKEEGDYYIVSNFRGGNIELQIGASEGRSLRTSIEKIFFIGHLKKNTYVKFSLSSEYNYALYGADLYRFDEGAFAETYDKLSENTAEVISASSTKIKAKINAAESGLLYTSIPYDGGWSLKVDGKKAKLDTFENFLCCANLEQGEHELEFSYSPPGFYAGLAISAFSVITVAALLFIKKRKRCKQN